MSSFTQRQWKAIARFVHDNQAKPQLSAFPYLRVTESNGKESSYHISTIEDWYTGAKEREKRQKAEADKKAKQA